MLQNNNGRKRRSVQPGGDVVYPEEEEENDHYSTVYFKEELIPELEDLEQNFKISSELAQENEKQSEELEESKEKNVKVEVKTHSNETQDVKTEEDSQETKEKVAQNDNVTDSHIAPRSLSFLENFFISLPQALGLRPKVGSSTFYSLKLSFRHTFF